MFNHYEIGDLLTDRYEFTGAVDAIFKNLASAIACGIVDRHWQSEQRTTPRADQVFYSLVNSGGAVLAGHDSVIKITVSV